MVAGAVGTESREAVDIGGDEADVAGAAFQRVERRHLGQPEVAVDAIELGEQRLVAFGGGHRRITAGVEGEGGAGARRMVGRSEERRGGKECGSTCGAGWEPYH